MIKFLAKIPLLLLPLIMIAVVNYYVDPANLFSGYHAEEIATIQKSGLSVYVGENFDERAVKKEYINLLTTAPKVLVVGSSRVMGITTEMVGNNEFFNFGVSVAGLYDIIGILGLCAKKDMLPETIIMGVDPWWFNDNYTGTRYQTLQEGIDYFHGEAPSSRMLSAFKIDPKYRELLSPSYFQNALRYVQENGLQVEKKVESTPKLQDSRQLFRFDGAVSYLESYRNASLEEINEKAKTYIAGDEVFQINNFSVISENYKQEFDTLIKFLQSADVRIMLYFVPYHPIVYDYLNITPKYAKALEVEDFITLYAQEHNIEVYGSYNPEVVEFTDRDFFDGMHLRTDNQVIKRSFGKAADSSILD